MPAELPKTYDPSSVESEAYRVWTEEQCFTANPAAPGEPYTIVIPPPNVTGALHLGHAMNATIQDVLVRQHRMRGFNTLWVPGIDHAGIATQAVVEKQLKEKENKTRHDVGREGLVERIWAWKQQYGDRILEQLKRIGASCDWTRTRFTLDDMLARAVRETFFKLFKDGLIYRGKRLVNWDVFLQTSVSDDEIYHETVKTSLWHIKYPIVDGPAPSSPPLPPGEGRGEGGVSTDALTPTLSRGERGQEGEVTYMVVATTRPETMLGDTAVAVHSEDPRWNWAIGKSVRLPLVDRLIPIIADDILVDPKFGSGVVKVTPAHDPNDYAVWKRHQGQPDEIDLINILTPDGRINEAGGAYAGLRRDQSRKKVVEDLTAQGLLAKEEPYETQVGHSDRSKTPIEPYLSDQWFVKMAPLAEPALEVVRESIIKFTPERYAQTYLAWLGEKRDWPISRQLWWGHRIPVWRATPRYPEGSTTLDHASIARLKDALDAFARATGNPNDLAVKSDESGQKIYFAARTDKANRALFEVWRELNRYIAGVVGPHEAAPVYNSPDHGSMEGYEAAYKLVALLSAMDLQDPDVLDTWFSSALWPHSTLGWPEESADLKRYYPTSVLVTSRDIITLWVARMVMTGIYNMGHGEFLANSEEEAKQKIASRKPQIEKAIPFKEVYIHPTILDGKGERMSKSKGNGVDPVDIIGSHGADALRLTLTQMATETQEVRVPVKKDAEGRNTSDKFDLGRNFCTKLWNAARFAFANIASIPPEPVDERTWGLADRWIVTRLNRTTAEIDAALASYRFDTYAKLCYDFFWRDFCDWYVEAIKPALKDPKRAGQTANVLATVLDGTLRLLHPMIPFITETIWWNLNEVRPQRGLPGRFGAPPSKRLVLAKWPTPGDVSQAAEHIFPKIQEIVVAIRNLRNEYKADPKKPVSASILAPGDAARSISENREMIEMLAICTLKDVRGDLAPPENAARASAAGCEIFIEGLVDENAEKQRVAKLREDLQRQISAMKGRLANESYTAKAPPHLVKQTRDQLAEAEAELAKL